MEGQNIYILQWYHTNIEVKKNPIKKRGAPLQEVILIWCAEKVVKT